MMAQDGSCATNLSSYIKLETSFASILGSEDKVKYPSKSFKNVKTFKTTPSRSPKETDSFVRVSRPCHKVEIRLQDVWPLDALERALLRCVTRNNRPYIPRTSLEEGSRSNGYGWQ